MDFRSFMVEGVDGEFHFLLKNISDSNDAPFEQDEVTLIESTNDDKTQNQRVSTSLKAAGKRKQTAESSEREPRQKFPSAKELKDSADCHFVPAHITLPSWKRHLKEISLERLCDIQDKAYMWQAVLDNMLNNRTRKLMSTLSKAKASCDAIRERKVKKDKAYAKLKRKCNKALQDFVRKTTSIGDDPIACLNKVLAFLTVVASSRFFSTNNQLKTSSNIRNQATVQDGRVTVQQVQGRQGQSYYGTGYKSNATSSGGNNATRYKDKVMLAEAQEAGQVLDEEQLAFLADLGVPDGQAIQTIIPNNAAFQTEDLDTYDSDCDDVSNAKAVLMANISNYGSDVISVEPILMIWKIKSNKTYEDFGKRFVPQQELSADEAFWYHMLNPSTKSSDALPVKIEAPKELPKVSLVNESLKKLKLHGKDNKEKDKIRSKTGKNQEQTGSVENFRIKPNKVKAQSKTMKESK
nr:hypothetical protein [Tanacetum cinerariifolium]